MYSLRTDSGVMSVPESWTDRKTQQKFNPDLHKLPFDAFTLMELAQLLQTFEDVSKEMENSVDKIKKER